jgi:hypothetical protein
MIISGSGGANPDWLSEYEKLGRTEGGISDFIFEKEISFLN